MSRVRLLVTGARGQLGSDLVALARGRGIAVTGLGSEQLDVTDAAAVDTAVASFAGGAAGAGAVAVDGGGPDGCAVVINAAAYTAVDRAQTDSARAYQVNESGPANLARAAARCGVGLIHVSTDYVFPGDATTPYEVNDPVGPRSVYGASKLDRKSVV